MDYHTPSRTQKKQSPSSSSKHSCSSRHSTSATTEPASSKYLTAIANSSTPYESPYAQNKDRISQPPSDSSYRTSSRSESVNPALSVPSPLPASISPYSSSSDGSLYRSSPAPQQHRQTIPRKMSSSRTMSAVSHFLHLSLVSDHYSFPYMYLSISALFLDLISASSLLGSQSAPCLASALALRRSHAFYFILTTTIF